MCYLSGPPHCLSKWLQTTWKLLVAFTSPVACHSALHTCIHTKVPTPTVQHVSARTGRGNWIVAVQGSDRTTPSIDIHWRTPPDRPRDTTPDQGRPHATQWPGLRYTLPTEVIMIAISKGTVHV